MGCTVDGVAGNGTSQGTCPADTKCHSDGSCSVCSFTADDHAGDESDPHSGCTKLNPTCNKDKTTCHCDESKSMICDKTTASVCHNKACRLSLIHI